MLSKNDIWDIANYLGINFNEKYYNKYVPLPMELNNKVWRWEGKDFPRVIALLEFREFMLEYNRTFENVLSFNAITPNDDPEYEYINYLHRDNYNYDDNETFDIHTVVLPKKDYDFAMLNQTIEHLYDPKTALVNIYNHMKSGGMFYANVPINGIPHNTPFQFYMGITAVGLGALVEMAGFKILKLGQWGNKKYLKQSYEKTWNDYNYSTDAGFNQMDYPVIAWCLAIKE
jgi:SAM-dependent methyltransferase